MSILGSTTLFYAALLCGALAMAVFDRPTWSRSYTTLLRYSVALVLHIAFHVWLLILAYIFLRAIGSAAGWSRSAWVWGAFLLAATAMVLPQPGLWLRHNLQRLADIPGRALRTSFRLVDAEMTAREETQIQARTTLHALGVGQDYGWLPPAQALYEQLFRATCLYVQLRDWEDVPRYKRFMEESHHDLFRLRQRFDSVSVRTSRTLLSMERLGQIRQEFARHASESHDIDAHLKSLIGESITDACEDISKFHRDACLFATRGILATRATSVARRRAFKKLGFAKLEVERPSLYFAFPVAAGVLFCGLWLCFLLLGVEPKDLKPAQLQLLIMLSQLGAIAVALLPKPFFAFATGGLHERTPWRFVAGAGCAALVLAVFVNVAFALFLKGDWEGVQTRFRYGTPYLPFAMLTAMATAWLMQDHRWGRWSSRWGRRGLDALVFGPVWLAAGCLAWVIGAGMVASGLPDPEVVITGESLIGMFLFGAAMGALIPEYTRERADAEGDAWTSLGSSEPWPPLVEEPRPLPQRERAA